MAVDREEAESDKFRLGMAQAGASPIALLAYDGISTLLLDILNEIRELKVLTSDIADQADRNA